jgi:hypothetical protein
MKTLKLMLVTLFLSFALSGCIYDAAYVPYGNVYVAPVPAYPYGYYNSYTRPYYNRPYYNRSYYATPYYNRSYYATPYYNSPYRGSYYGNPYRNSAGHYRRH